MNPKNRIKYQVSIERAPENECPTHPYILKFTDDIMGGVARSYIELITESKANELSEALYIALKDSESYSECPAIPVPSHLSAREMKHSFWNP